MTLPIDFKQGSPERVIGTSVDCSLQPLAGSDAAEEAARRLRYLSPDHIFATTSLGSTPFNVTKSTGSFATTHLENGGALTIRDGRAAYTAPEVIGPYNAAIAYLAGIHILDKVTEQVFASPGSGALLHRNAGIDLSGTYKSRPAYSVYYTPTGTVISQNAIGKLMTFLSTNVWTGAGMVGMDGMEWRQSARGIGMPFNSNKSSIEGDKPMALKYTLGAWERIEVCIDDARISPLTQLMDRAAMSGLLRLLEQDPRGAITGNLPIATNAVKSFGYASKDPSLKTVVPVRIGSDQTEMTTLDIQRRYIEAMLTLSDSDPARRFPHFERFALQAALNTLNTLSSPGRLRLDVLSDTLEIAARHQYLAEKLGHSAILDYRNTKAWSHGLAYDFSTYRTSALKYWNARGDEITRDIMSRAKHAATRAHPHGTVSDARMSAIRTHGSDITSISPRDIIVGGKSVFMFTSPYQTEAA